ncbi:glutaredoxin family protein [Ideonella sp.]|uniref:glutaredoxin family protein n=1 Tax=Ideonella sp. TaxID=1929293 RepID=UPI002B486F0E|nr:glutaredoxin family protein [Ideonella sp.]HJV69328.1 glutaredoxin family protein [Ideonella sp.]
MTRTTRLTALLASGLALTLAALPAHAVYKVIGPDGKVTYTDTPPPDGKAKVTPVAVGSGGGAPNLSGLPAELQQAATKYPVTLYSTRDCRPCDAGRRLLQQRGIPFAETTLAATSADQAALQQLAGTTNLPVLTIGQQQLKGLTPGEWHGYLDAAGYPRESKLPSSYRAPAPTPMTAVAEPAPAAGTDAAPAAAPAPAAPARPASGPNIRF